MFIGATQPVRSRCFKCKCSLHKAIVDLDKTYSQNQTSIVAGKGYGYVLLSSQTCFHAHEGRLRCYIRSSQKGPTAPWSCEDQASKDATNRTRASLVAKGITTSRQEATRG